MKGVTAIVPMRHNSERVPGKNYRLLGKKPLYHHVVESLMSTPSVAAVLIDTDSEFILNDVAVNLPGVRTIVRPEHLRDGHTPMNTVLENTLSHCETEVVLQTHSTNPFVQPRTFERAIGSYFEQDDCDSVFGVSRIQGRLWTEDLRPVNHDPAILARTQDLNPIYLENSCFYIFSKTSFASFENRLGARPRAIEVDAIEAVDIDEEMDFRLAEAIERAGLMGEK